MQGHYAAGQAGREGRGGSVDSGIRFTNSFKQFLENTDDVLNETSFMGLKNGIKKKTYIDFC